MQYAFEFAIVFEVQILLHAKTNEDVESAEKIKQQISLHR